MFQITLTGKFVMFQEYLMIASEPRRYGGETREPKSWKISHTKSEKKIKKGKKSKSINQAMNCLQIKYNSFN